MSVFKRNLARALACLVSAGLLALSGSLHPVWAAAWIASVPVLAAAFLSSRLTGFGLAFLAGLLGGVPLLLYLLDVTPPVAAVMVTVVLALAYAAGVALAAGARRRLPPAVAVFVFPAWAAGLDTAIAHLSQHGTAASLAYSQMDFTPALQVAALGGAAAVIFLVCLFASGLAFALADLKAPRRALAAAGPAALVVLAGLGFGVWRLEAAPATPTLTVAMAALDQKSQLPDDWRAVVAAYRPAIAAAQARGARLLVLPEEISRIPARDLPAMQAELAGYAHASGATLAAGFRVMEPPKDRNRLYVFTPDGRVATYDKRHLIPGLESSAIEAGRRPVLAADVGGLRLGGAICKDFDFTDTSRGLAHAGAQLVVAPAWDFGEDAWLHARMAMLRAVEDGFTLVRSARRGEMSISDRYGRVLAEAPSGPDAPVLIAQAPIPHAPAPLYARIGDVFGWACAAFALLVWGLLVWSWGLLARRRPSASPQNGSAARSGSTHSRRAFTENSVSRDQ